MSSFLTALAGERPARTPIWFMRQAGRSLPEYREVRRGTGMLESCLIPEMAAEITVQPVRRHRVDAAVFFSDIMVPLKLAGVPVDIRASIGPVFDRRYATADAIAELVDHTLGDVSAISEACRLAVASLGEVPLLGFAGAPFTLAAYLVEGAPSRDHLAARGLMHSDPEAWASLMGWCADLSRAFLETQVAAGASAVQLFDSWAGSLSRADYVAYVQPYAAKVIDGIGVPSIHFGTNTGHLLAEFDGIGATAVGIDYRTPLDEALSSLRATTVVQGNIDPAILTAPWPVIENAVRDVVARGAGAPAHIVNLGHGVPPSTDPDVLTRIVELVHSL